MTLNEMRRLERTLEEMNIDIDTIIALINLAQQENKLNKKTNYFKEI